MRAEGLWEEIGADLYAETAAEAVHIAGQPRSQLPTLFEHQTALAIGKAK